MMLTLKSGPQIAAKVGNPAGLLCRRIWYSVVKSGGARDNGIPPRSTPEHCILTSSQGSTLAVFRYPEHPRFSDGIPDSLAQ